MHREMGHPGNSDIECNNPVHTKIKTWDEHKEEAKMG